MPNPTTNPTRLSRTEREVAWSPLPGDAIRFPSGHRTTMASAPDARERFLKTLAQAPMGSAVVPYDGRQRAGFATSAEITRTIAARDMGALRRGVYLPEILDRWMCSGDGRKSEALTALDFTANLPEAPFVHHAANILHCMVKFGAPAFVVTISVGWAHLGAEALRATNLLDLMRKFPADPPVKETPRRCPRTDPRPGDLCIMGDYVKVFTDVTPKEVWRIGAPRTRWVRVEDAVGLPK